MSATTSLLIYGGNMLIVYFLMKYAAKSEKNKLLFYALMAAAILIPSILGGLRYGIGTDYFERYLPDFLKIESDITASTKVEVGFEFISRVVVFFGLGFQWMLFVVQLLTNGLVFSTIIRYKKSLQPELASLIYMLLYYQCSYNLVRQCLSMAIIFFAIRYIEEKSLLKYVLFCVLAATIHTTAIIAVPLYFIFNVWTKSKYKYIKWILYAALAFIIFNFSVVFDFMNRYLSLNYYERYMPTSSIEGISLYFFFKWFLYLVPGMVLMYYKYHGKDKDDPFFQKFSFFLAFTVCGFLFSLTSYMGSRALFRLSYYFNMGLVILLPLECEGTKLFLKLPGKNRRVNLMTLYSLAVMIVVWYYEYFIRLQGETVPFQWVL